MLKKLLPFLCIMVLCFSGCGSDDPAVSEGSSENGTNIEMENNGDSETGENDADGAENESDESENESDDSKNEDSSVNNNESSNNDANKSASDNGGSQSSSSGASGSSSSASSQNSSSGSSAQNSSSAGSSQSGSSAGSQTSASAPAPEPSYKYKDGTYTGSAQGFNGAITVSLTVSKDRITAVSVTSSIDDEPYLSDAKAVCSKIVSSNSTDVSAVSGATYSSNGIKGAAKAALAKAQN